MNYTHIFFVDIYTNGAWTPTRSGRFYCQMCGKYLQGLVIERVMDNIQYMEWCYERQGK